MKRCPKCGETKAAEFFQNCKIGPKNKSGLQSYCRLCQTAYTRAWRKAHPDRVKVSDRRTQLKAKYGLTLEKYDEMLAEQGGGCAVCGTDDPGRNDFFSVDHDHDTGKVRGLLCNPCNLGIGNLGDDVERISAAASYLQRAA